MVALAGGAATNLLYARLLSTSVIGSIAVVYALSAGLVLLGDSGLQLLMTRALAARITVPPRAISILLGGVPILVTAWWGFVYSLTFETRHLWGFPAVSGTHALLVLELALSLVLFQVSLTLYQGLGEYGWRAGLVVANGLLTAVFTGIALELSASFVSAVQATVIAYAVVAFTGLIRLLIRFPPTRVALSEFGSFLREARFIWGNSALTFTYTTGDVLLAALFLPLSAVGIYRIYKAIAAVFLAPLSSLLPLFYAHFSRLDIAARTRAYRLIGQRAIDLVAAALLITAPLFPWLIGETFGPSFERHLGALLGVIVMGGIGFSHILLGCVNTASGLYRRPLVINAAVFGAFLAASPLLSRLFGLDGFVAAGILANIAGLLAAALLTRRLVNVGAATLAGVPTCVLLTAAAVSYSLMKLRLFPAEVIACSAALTWAFFRIGYSGRQLVFWRLRHVARLR